MRYTNSESRADIKERFSDLFLFLCKYFYLLFVVECVIGVDLFGERHFIMSTTRLSQCFGLEIRIVILLQDERG